MKREVTEIIIIMRERERERETKGARGSLEIFTLGNREIVCNSGLVRRFRCR